MFNINGINTNGILNQYINQLQNSISNTSGNVYQNNYLGSITSFSQILSKISGKMNGINNMFQMAFPANNVEIKVGNCNVPWEVWNRNDFPIWQYFQENTSVECLNNWSGAGAEPPQSDVGVQQGLRQIKFGEMVIIMPENLQKKMESDSEYAKEVLNKVQKWKENYDREDNAIAAVQGHDPELFQMTKSYYIHLDEGGNVEKHVVISGGMDTRKAEKKAEKEKAVLEKKASKTVKSKRVQRVVSNIVTGGIETRDYEKIGPYLTIYRQNKK